MIRSILRASTRSPNRSRWLLRLGAPCFGCALYSGSSRIDAVESSCFLGGILVGSRGHLSATVCILFPPNADVDAWKATEAEVRVIALIVVADARAWTAAAGVLAT